MPMLHSGSNTSRTVRGLGEIERICNTPSSWTLKISCPLGRSSVSAPV